VGDGDAKIAILSLRVVVVSLCAHHRSPFPSPPDYNLLPHQGSSQRWREAHGGCVLVRADVHRAVAAQVAFERHILKPGLMFKG
jgi:hypothetical protein